MFLGPLKTLLFSAALWLPLSFFVWFYLSAILVMPVRWLAEQVLVSWMPQIFTGSEQLRHLVTMFTVLPVDQGMLPPGVDPSMVQPISIDVNPMIYGYSFPVLIGLVMATPLKLRQRMLQIAIALACLWPIQSFGVVFDVLKSLRFESGDIGVAAIQGAGLSANLLAFCYQLGYLILPAVFPIFLWVAMNKRFIERLVTVDDDRLEDVVYGGEKVPAERPTKSPRDGEAG
ncbi:MAG: hypothetical protein KDI37_10465 [Xanthomonadales bacterium]|nr:hypothetical protein [Xanthomonadales bacterium]